MMFDAVNRLSQHSKRVAALITQRTQLHAKQVYRSERMATLEAHLLHHLYTLTTHEAFEFSGGVKFNFKHMAEQNWLTFINEVKSLNVTFDDAELPLIALCANRLLHPAEISLELLHELNETAPKLLELTLYNPDAWLQMPSTSLINLALSQPQALSQAFKFRLFSTLACSTQLSEALQNNDFDIVYGAFVNCYLTKNSAMETALFSAFSRFNEPEQKAKLLAIAGLIGEPKWQEIALAFCKANPKFIEKVLNYFHKKSALQVVIQLLETASTLEDAERVWINLTQKPLRQIPQMQLLDASCNEPIAPGKATRGAPDDAIYGFQYIMQQPHVHIWQGVNYSNEHPNAPLSLYAGLVTQRVIAKELPLNLGAWACWQSHDQHSWQKVVHASC